MAIKASQPIGIFDSGIGGMTVAHAVKAILPNEQLVYFGDTAHLPYGDKSTAAIQAYSIKITDVLLQKGCKLILIACNSASAAAFDLVREYTGSRAKVFNVIDPVVDYIREHYDNTKIGLIGTRQTVTSGTYQRKIDALDQNIECKALATPLLVPMIEESWLRNDISKQIINSYLAHEELSDITSLILGCTHYPLIKSQIEEYYFGKVDILDTAAIVAKSVKAYLEYNHLQSSKLMGSDHFLVSDLTPNFEATTKLFFGSQVPLEKYPLWE
jgi:glutamate racemase